MPGSAGDNYVTFMLPGIVVLSALGGAIGGGSVWLTERLRGIVKEFKRISVQDRLTITLTAGKGQTVLSGVELVAD